MVIGMKDNIWFTYKARIQAQSRLEYLDTHSQFLLVWYAILGAVLAIISIRYPVVLNENTDIYAAILSVALLVLSLVISNRDFRGRSIKMRENYIAMHKLYILAENKLIDNDQLIHNYFTLLNDVENHKAIDDKIFRVKSQAFLTSRKPTCFDKVNVIFSIFVMYFLTIFLYLFPFLFLMVYK